jgi:hypothetical protein
MRTENQSSSRNLHCPVALCGHAGLAGSGYRYGIPWVGLWEAGWPARLKMTSSRRSPTTGAEALWNLVNAEAHIWFSKVIVFGELLFAEGLIFGASLEWRRSSAD